MLVNGVNRSKKIVVLLGGISPEREISLDSGRNVIAGLLELGFDVIGVDPAQKEWQAQLLEINPCYVFIVLHGPNGEDGSIQGFLKTYNFMHSGSDVLGCAISMDKAKAKNIWQSQGLPTLPFMLVKELNAETMQNIKTKFKLPLCLKIVNGGSSIGIKRVATYAELPQAFTELQQYKSDIICENWLDNIREYTVGILQNKALPVIEIKAESGYYDFEAKYKRSDTQYICPCDISKELASVMQSHALKAFTAIGCSHFGRIDFILDEGDNMYILEANAVPGFTRKSLVPMAAKKVGYSFTNLLLNLLPKFLQDITAVSPRS